jgi:uncharacterized protein (TIGR02284 family)
MVFAIHGAGDPLMATETKEVTSVLNGLIETCKDGETGFRTAAEKVKEPSLKALFLKYSSQRAGYVQELTSLVSSMGEKPAESGHIAASLHRGWMGLKEALSKDEDTALINEAEAGEDAAMKAYREAVAANLPAAASALVQKQFSGVQEAHGIMRDLKHSRN